MARNKGLFKTVYLVLPLALVLLVTIVAIPQLSKRQTLINKAEEIRVTCEEGISSFTGTEKCGVNKYRFVNYSCYDGYSFSLGTKGGVCTPKSVFDKRAYIKCKNHIGCTPYDQCNSLKNYSLSNPCDKGYSFIGFNCHDNHSTSLSGECKSWQALVAEAVQVCQKLNPACSSPAN